MGQQGRHLFFPWQRASGIFSLDFRAFKKKKLSDENKMFWILSHFVQQNNVGNDRNATQNIWVYIYVGISYVILYCRTEHWHLLNLAGEENCLFKSPLRVGEAAAEGRFPQCARQCFSILLYLWKRKRARESRRWLHQSERQVGSVSVTASSAAHIKHIKHWAELLINQPRGMTASPAIGPIHPRMPRAVWAPGNIPPSADNTVIDRCSPSDWGSLV